MVAETSWQELCRFDDVLLARAVATSIAAMEFEVRLCAVGAGHAARGDAAEQPGPPPYIVQVSPAQWSDLAEILDEIIREQREFDRLLTERRTSGSRAVVVTVIGLTGAVDVLVLLGLLDW